MRTVRVALLGVSLGLAACGGSSSESPWPVEPLDAVRGPKGELLPGKGASDLAGPSAVEDEPGAEGEGTEREPDAEGAVRARTKTGEDEAPAVDGDEQSGSAEGQGGGHAAGTRRPKGATRRSRSGGR